MKQKKKTKAIAMILSLMMVFTFMPFMGTQKAYAVQNNGTVTIDLTEGAQTYEGSEAAVLYLLIDSAIKGQIIKAHGFAGSGGLYQLLLDMNDDNVDDMKLDAVVYDGVAQSLQLSVVEGCSQSGKYGLRIDNATAHNYLEIPDINEYGLDHFYDTVMIEFPEIQHVKINDPNTLIIPLENGMVTYYGAEAAAIYTLLMDPNTQDNYRHKIHHDDTVYENYMTCNFFLDNDYDPDIYATFNFNDSGVCENASFELFPEYFDYDSIIIYLPQDRLNYYGSLSVPNEYGLEYVYQCLLFDARFYGTESIKNADVELSATAFSYNEQVQKPAIVKIGGSKLVEGEDYDAEWSNDFSKDVGTYTVKITGKGKYRGTTTATYTINKAANSLTVQAKTAKIKYKKLKKKNQKLAVGKVITVANYGQGALTYTKVSGNKKISVNANNGTVTIKKKLKKGTYKVTVNVNATGTNNYEPMTRTVTFKVKVTK